MSDCPCGLSGFWDWIWLCGTRRGTCWIPTRPALSVCSGPTRRRPAVWTTASRRRRWRLVLQLKLSSGFSSSRNQAPLSPPPADAAPEPGDAAPDTLQHRPYLQPAHESQEFCLQHRRGRRAVDVSVRPRPVRVYQVGVGRGGGLTT